MKNKTFNQAARQIGEQVADLVTAKQHDYGPKNILNCPVGVHTGILVRMYDKFARLNNLLDKDDPKNETLEDTWLDIMGYALIGLMIQRGEFELPLNDKIRE